MPVLHANDPNAPFDPKASVAVPGEMLPNFRTIAAIHRGVDKNILIVVHGGLGDAICAEPSIRYALSSFKGIDVSISTHWPELFKHLPLKKVYNVNHETPDLEKYFVFKTLYPDSDFHQEFIAHMFTHVVDYHSIAMWRVQLSPIEKQIQLHCSPEAYQAMDAVISSENDILIHAGLTWPSRTMPAFWWNDVISRIKKSGKRPVLIGGKNNGTTGTVDVNRVGCLDLRGQLSLEQSVAVTKIARVLLTNDSSPIHMAASGNAWIGFLSTVKRPDLLLHWRHEKFGWRMQNLATGGKWQTFNMSPNNGETFRFDLVDPSHLMNWLPKPHHVGEWALNKLKDAPVNEDH